MGNRKLGEQGDETIARSGRFPFAVFCTLQDETVCSRAVVDGRRNPAWIRRRLR